MDKLFHFKNSKTKVFFLIVLCHCFSENSLENHQNTEKMLEFRSKNTELQRVMVIYLQICIIAKFYLARMLLTPTMNYH